MKRIKWIALPGVGALGLAALILLTAAVDSAIYRATDTHTGISAGTAIGYFGDLADAHCPLAKAKLRYISIIRDDDDSTQCHFRCWGITSLSTSAALQALIDADTDDELSVIVTEETDGDDEVVRYDERKSGICSTWLAYLTTSGFVADKCTVDVDHVTTITGKKTGSTFKAICTGVDSDTAANVHNLRVDAQTDDTLDIEIIGVVVEE